LISLLLAIAYISIACLQKDGTRIIKKSIIFVFSLDKSAWTNSLV